ncbi:MAG: hypothetical protein WB511_01640 [Nitrososphaeraceae archaeon]
MLESTLKLDPDKNDLTLIFSFECLNTYMFMLTTMPKSIDVIFVRIKPTTPSGGR